MSTEYSYLDVDKTNIIRKLIYKYIKKLQWYYSYNEMEKGGQNAVHINQPS